MPARRKTHLEIAAPPCSDCSHAVNCPQLVESVHSATPSPMPRFPTDVGPHLAAPLLRQFVGQRRAWAAAAAASYQPCSGRPDVRRAVGGRRARAAARATRTTRRQRRAVDATAGQQVRLRVRNDALRLLVVGRVQNALHRLHHLRSRNQVKISSGCMPLPMLRRKEVASLESPPLTRMRSTICTTSQCTAAGSSNSTATYNATVIRTLPPGTRGPIRQQWLGAQKVGCSGQRRARPLTSAGQASGTGSRCRAACQSRSPAPLPLYPLSPPATLSARAGEYVPSQGARPWRFPAFRFCQ